MACDRRFVEGMPYAKTLEGFQGDGTPVTEIVCVPCGMGLPVLTGAAA